MNMGGGNKPSGKSMLSFGSPVIHKNTDARTYHAIITTKPLTGPPLPRHNTWRHSLHCTSLLSPYGQFTHHTYANVDVTPHLTRPTPPGTRGLH